MTDTEFLRVLADVFKPGLGNAERLIKIADRLERIDALGIDARGLVEAAETYSSCPLKWPKNRAKPPKNKAKGRTKR